jgi:hypothetical protein
MLMRFRKGVLVEHRSGAPDRATLRAWIASNPPASVSLDRQGEGWVRLGLAATRQLSVGRKGSSQPSQRPAARSACIERCRNEPSTG